MTLIVSWISEKLRTSDGLWLAQYDARKKRWQLAKKNGAGYSHYRWFDDRRELEKVVEVLEAQRRAKEIGSLPLAKRVARFERLVIETTLKRLNGNRENTAKALGIPRSSLYKRLKEWGMTNA